MYCVYCRKEVETPHRCDETTKGTLYQSCISEYKEKQINPASNLRTLHSNGRRSVPHKKYYR